MVTIYLASSWRNGFHASTLEELKNAGFAVYDFKKPWGSAPGFDWKDIDPNWENWTTEQFIAALQHPIADRGFNNDNQGMGISQICVLLLPCGRSAHAEAGYMAGAGKMVYVLQPIKQEPELMYKLFNGVFSNVADLVRFLKNRYYGK